MDYKAQLDDLERHVAAIKASVAQAANENHEQLKKRITQAQDETDRAIAGASQQATAAADKAKAGWEQKRAEARADLAALKAKAQHRADQIDANLAATDADAAEADAGSAINFADWAIDNARLAILDAIDARAYAVERAGAIA